MFRNKGEFGIRTLRRVLERWPILKCQRL